MSLGEKHQLARAAAALDDVELETAIDAARRGDFEVLETKLKVGLDRLGSQRTRVGPSWRNTGWIFGRSPGTE